MKYYILKGNKPDKQDMFILSQDTHVKCRDIWRVPAGVRYLGRCHLPMENVYEFFNIPTKHEKLISIASTLTLLWSTIAKMSKFGSSIYTKDLNVRPLIILNGRKCIIILDMKSMTR